MGTFLKKGEQYDLVIPHSGIIPSLVAYILGQGGIIPQDPEVLAQEREQCLQTQTPPARVRRILDEEDDT